MNNRFMWGREPAEEILADLRTGAVVATSLTVKLEPGGVRYGNGPLTATEARMRQMEVNARHQWYYDAAAYRRAALQHAMLTLNPPMILKEEPVSIKQHHIEVSHVGKASGWVELIEGSGVFQTTRRVRLVEEPEAPAGSFQRLAGEDVTGALASVAAERSRQIREKGYTPKSDAKWARIDAQNERGGFRLARLAIKHLAAVAFPQGRVVHRKADPGTDTIIETDVGSMSSRSLSDNRQRLVRAAALLLAEIERIDANGK